MIYRKDEHTDELKPQMRGGEGTVKLTALADELPNHVRLFSLITVPVAGSIGYHKHENETELFYFIQGTALVSDDGQATQVGAGDVMKTPSGSSHSVENIGDEDVLMLACIVTD